GQGSQGQAGGRGPRTVRKRRAEKRVVEDYLLDYRAANHSFNIGREPSRILDEDWNDEKTGPIHMEAAD
ncbi:homeobox domain protein, partial [Trifolium medium]|nr:homeobox domain protein [Trifolium medium]